MKKIISVLVLVCFMFVFTFPDIVVENFQDTGNGPTIKPIEESKTDSYKEGYLYAKNKSNGFNEFLSAVNGCTTTFILSPIWTIITMFSISSEFEPLDDVTLSGKDGEFIKGYHDGYVDYVRKNKMQSYALGAIIGLFPALIVGLTYSYYNLLK